MSFTMPNTVAHVPSESKNNILFHFKYCLTVADIWRETNS